MTKTMTEMTLIKISLQKRNYFKEYMREGWTLNSMFKVIPICNMDMSLNLLQNVVQDTHLLCIQR